MRCWAATLLAAIEGPISIDNAALKGRIIKAVDTARRISVTGEIIRMAAEARPAISTVRFSKM